MENNRTGDIRETESTSSFINDGDEESQASESLKDFFLSKGLKVVDKREKGGCLWVIGNKDEIDQYIREACNKFHIGGTYGSGRATGYKPGWFTKSQK